ncbi:MAG: uroporphyrinogen-III synthase [Methylovirgula sp.]|uniref:uroporphyrinogen-III synthase n=1 Tax=Methylovirgula sp. TaxID=1978224 RepID=UPI0030763FEA
MQVLITRPAEQAHETAAVLSVLGHEALLSPVVEVVPTDNLWPRGTIDLVVATSARAFEALLAQPDFPTAEARRLIPLYLVGEKTCEAARLTGFAGPAVMADTAKDLAPKLIAQLRSYTRALYLAGRERKPKLERMCVDAGFTLDVLETYAAAAASRLSDAALAALDEGTVSAVLHYSQRSTAIFLELLEAEGFDPAALHHIAISEDAAIPLRELNLPHIDVAAQPDEDSMLALLPAGERD